MTAPDQAVREWLGNASVKELFEIINSSWSEAKLAFLTFHLDPSAASTAEIVYIPAELEEPQAIAALDFIWRQQRMKGRQQ
jgi:hypothetical protein